ncbi:MAG: hypothetical protein HQL77_16100 [Magnetococcales bacterium]|nr:hypothetical protein [Magnetococcales bacterium]
MIDEKSVKCRRVSVSGVGTIENPKGSSDLDFRSVAAMFFSPEVTYVPTVVPIQEIDELDMWQCLVTWHGLNGPTERYLVNATNVEIFDIFQHFITIRRKISGCETHTKSTGLVGV